MKRLKYITFFLVSFSLLITNIKGATCSYEQRAKLNKEIVNVKTKYYIKERVLDKSEYIIPEEIAGTPEEETYEKKVDYFQIDILNLTENLYAEVTNNHNYDKITYTYGNTDKGKISFNQYDIMDITKYTIKIYASENTDCQGTLLKTLTLNLPRYNMYSEYSICQELSKYYLCQKYVNFEEIEFNEFATKTAKEIDKIEEEIKEESKWYNKFGKFIKEHKVEFIAGGIMLIVVAGGATYIIIRKRRRDVI